MCSEMHLFPPSGRLLFEITRKQNMNLPLVSQTVKGETTRYQITCFPVVIVSTANKGIVQLCRIKQAEWEKRQTPKEQEREGH